MYSIDLGMHALEHLFLLCACLLFCFMYNSILGFGMHSLLLWKFSFSAWHIYSAPVLPSHNWQYYQIMICLLCGSATRKPMESLVFQVKPSIRTFKSCCTSTETHGSQIRPIQCSLDSRCSGLKHSCSNSLKVFFFFFKL